MLKLSKSVTDVLGDGISDISIVDHMGNDHSVVRAARVSYAGDKEEWRGEPDKKLIRYMAEHDHGTPFEHTAITFHVACPLFVRGQWHRHRIGWSYNEISRRYTSEDLDFYIPSVDEWRMQDKLWNKQSSSGYFPSERGRDFCLKARHAVSEHVKLYEQLLKEGVAREQARMLLPQNMYTRFYATCNLRSAAHFIGLRADEHAQEEIRKYADSMYTQLHELYPISMEALCYG